MVDKEIVVKQIEVLKHLAYQSCSYQLLAGRDLYEEPEKISEVLSGVMSENKILKDSCLSADRNSKGEFRIKP